MADGDDGRLRQRLDDGLVEGRLADLVDGGRRLVEEEPVGLAEDGAGERQALLFATRKDLVPGGLLVEARDEARRFIASSAATISASE